jgi:hypothetical protein
MLGESALPGLVRSRANIGFDCRVPRHIFPHSAACLEISSHPFLRASTTSYSPAHAASCLSADL